MTFDLKTTVTALALILTPLAAQAHHRADHGGGSDRASEARQGGGGLRSGRGLRGGNEAAEVRGDRPCAWGLADRDEPCVPPGQDARGVTTSDWIGAPTEGYTVGDDISGDYREILNTAELGLDTELLDAGETYALVGDTIVVVDDAGSVTEVVRRAAFPGRPGN